MDLKPNRVVFDLENESRFQLVALAILKWINQQVNNGLS